MSVLPKLASSLGRRDEIPNQELARQLVKTPNAGAIRELVDHLDHKSKDIRYDCIKVLYEIGEANPTLIAGYGKKFIELLDHKNNRLQWGAMTALNTITMEAPALVYQSLPKIMAAAAKGSVITRDQAVNILIKLCSIKKYEADAFVMLNEQLISSPANQLPMYAENVLPVIQDSNRKQFVKVLEQRLPEMEKESKRKRVEKLISKVQAKQ